MKFGENIAKKFANAANNALKLKNSGVLKISGKLKTEKIKPPMTNPIIKIVLNNARSASLRFHRFFN